MKKQNIHIFITVLIASLIFTCKSQKRLLSSNKILEIYSWNKCQEKGDRFHSLKIRKDSTIMISSTEKSTDTLRDVTDYKKWSKMTELLNVRDFTKFEPRGNAISISDGCVSGISIKTKDSVYTKSGIIFNKSIEESETINDLIVKTSS